MNSTCAGAKAADPVRHNRIPRRRESRPGLFSRLHRWVKRRSLAIRLADLDDHIAELRRHMQLDREEAAALRGAWAWRRAPHLANRMAMDEDQLTRLTRERNQLVELQESLQ